MVWLKFETVVGKKFGLGFLVKSLLGGVIVAVFAFQNCAKVATYGGAQSSSSQSAATGTDATASLSGNGNTPYDGKPYTYFGPCESAQNAPVETIVVLGGNMPAMRTLKNCAPVNPPEAVLPAEISEIQENFLISLDRVFYRPGLELVVEQDFIDVLAAQPGSLVTSTARVSGFAGLLAMEARGNGAELSVDGQNWSRITRFMPGQNISIRSLTPAGAASVTRVIGNLGVFELDWLISSFPNPIVFATPGTFTFNRPAIGSSFKISCWGAGGGAGGGGGSGTVGGSGGGGGFSEVTVPRSSLAASEIVVVGAGGVGVIFPTAPAFSNGADGGASRFGALVNAGGGGRGFGIGNGGANGAGGMGSTANGQAGQAGRGGNGGGPGGGLGGGPGAVGSAPGGGGGGSIGAGGGGANGNGAPAPGPGGNGRCEVFVTL